MTYIVTHDSENMAALDLGKPSGFDLEGALAHACRLIDERKLNVAIQDGKGHSISGEALVACCCGTKTLTADLKAK
jgi:hypothetical protein